MEKIILYKEQLSRMRSMNRYYHDQFLLDVRILFIFNTVFIFLSLNNKNALYLIPLISLFGSVLLSFHAYFLIFSRHYSEFIEKNINSEYDENVLIAHELENHIIDGIGEVGQAARPGAPSAVGAGKGGSPSQRDRARECGRTNWLVPQQGAAAGRHLPRCWPLQHHADPRRCAPRRLISTAGRTVGETTRSDLRAYYFQACCGNS